MAQVGGCHAATASLSLTPTTTQTFAGHFWFRAELKILRSEPMGFFAYRDLDECLALIAWRVPTAWRSAKIAVIARLPNRSPIRRARIPASSSPQQFPQAIRILVVDRLLSNLRP
jgi:hypothetical protein